MGAMTACIASRISRGVAPSFRATRIWACICSWSARRATSHDDLQQLLGLAVEQPLAGVSGLDELAVLLRPFRVGQGVDAVHFQGVAPGLGGLVNQALGVVLVRHGGYLVTMVGGDLQVVVDAGGGLEGVVLLEQVGVRAAGQRQVVGEQLQGDDADDGREH